MRGFFSGLAKLWREFRKRRRYAAVIAPDAIGRMAQELSHLAELARRHADLPDAEARQLLNLRDEMRHLTKLVEKPEFCRLPAGRRLALHHSLQRSQEKLLASIQSTHAPTARIQ